MGRRGFPATGINAKVEQPILCGSGSANVIKADSPLPHSFDWYECRINIGGKAWTHSS